MKTFWVLLVIHSHFNTSPMTSETYYGGTFHTEHGCQSALVGIDLDPEDRNVVGVCVPEDRYNAYLELRQQVEEQYQND